MSRVSTQLAILIATAIAWTMLAPASWAEERPVLERADIGIADNFKVGCWTPLRLQIRGGEQKHIAVAEIRVPDSDGDLTSVLSDPFELPAGDVTTCELGVRIGRLDVPVSVNLISVGDNAGLLARRQFQPLRPLDDGGVPDGLPATARLLVEIGPNRLGPLSDETQRGSESWYTATVVAPIPDLSVLPRNWMLYEGVDTVLISTSNRDIWNSLTPGDPRIRALTNWVEMGGRVILFCGQNAAEVIGPGGPLERFSPGEFQSVAIVDELGPLESYVGAKQAVPGGKAQQLGVPQLSNVRGDVELTFGGDEQPLPLVVRTRVGLGQVVFAGFDIDEPPLRNWKERDQFAAKLLDFGPRKDDTDLASIPDDLSDNIAQKLDEQLQDSGISTPPFIAIAGLVLLYIALIGPGDYFLVKHVLKRMEWTWLTFPIIVATTSAAAYWYANYLKGDDLRVNQVEVVDIDTTTGLTRGTMWTHVFSPAPERYTLEVEAKAPDGSAAEARDSQVAWFGRTFAGLGGMNGGGGNMIGLATRPAYGWSNRRSRMEGVPIEVWSTKTFASRWRSQSKSTIDSDLTKTYDDLLTGELTNRMGVDLSECKLVYGNWAWPLGNIAAGETVAIESQDQIGGAKKLVKLESAFQQNYGYEGGQGTVIDQRKAIRRVDLAGQVEFMMFFDALDGDQTTHLWNRSQQYVDLSRSLDSSTAMLVGRCQEPRSELARFKNKTERESMRGDKDLYVVIYRFLLPVSDP